VVDFCSYIQSDYRVLYKTCVLFIYCVVVNFSNCSADLLILIVVLHVNFGLVFVGLVYLHLKNYLKDFQKHIVASCTYPRYCYIIFYTWIHLC